MSINTPYGRLILAKELGNLHGKAQVEYVRINKGMRFRVHLGFAMELPKGYKAILIPRSSTPEKLEAIQANSEGLIDQTYCGDDDEWMQEFVALEDTVIVIGERIGQFYLHKNEEVAILEVDSLSNPSRGGFGKGTADIK